MNEYYFFYCIKQNDDIYPFVIFKDVIKVQDTNVKIAREKAKKIMFERHPDIPRSFRKSTDKYFFLVETHKEQYAEIENFECKFCGKKIEHYQGIKNKYILDGFCCFDCNNRYLKLKKELYENEINSYLDEDRNDDLNSFINYYSSKRIGYIYLITNKTTNKVYVGQTTQEPLFRWWQHLKDINKFERKSLCDLKFEVIEIIDIGKDDYNELKRRLFEKEDYYIKFYDSLEPNGYNKINAKERKNNIDQIILNLDKDISEVEE